MKIEVFDSYNILNIIQTLYMTTNQSTEKNVSVSYKIIENLYDNLSYFDLYGTSVLLFISITIIAFIIQSYFVTKKNMSAIKANWINERCKPSVIPFAGVINPPDGVSPREFTQQNFTYCVQDILKNMSEYALLPITFLLNSITNVYKHISVDIQRGREMFAHIRTQMATIVENIMNRLVNILIPIQLIIITFNDIISKIMGIFNTILMTTLGIYDTLKALLGSIVEFIVIILISMSALIMGFMLFPPTFGLAQAMIGTFVLISVPLATIATLMKVIFHTHTRKIPKVPKFRKCFDEDTRLTMQNETKEFIKDVCVGNTLLGNNTINTKITLCAKNTNMYDLYGIIVSGTHTVYYNGEWGFVKNHPDAILIPYCKPYIYSLNVHLKKFSINGIILTDWDELYAHHLSIIKNKLKLIKSKYYNLNDTYFKYEDIHKYLNGGFSGDTLIKLMNNTSKMIKNINVGDILENNNYVYGVVEINGSTLSNQYKYDLGKSIIEGGPNLFYDNSSGIKVSTLYLEAKHKKGIAPNRKLYHLLTTTGIFYIKKCKFYDYNSLIDFI
jgi:hypothetical protein